MRQSHESSVCARKQVARNDVKGCQTMDESRPVQAAEELECVDALRLRVQALDAEREALGAIVLRVTEARMCRDKVTMIETCPHCSLKRGSDYGYGGTHDEHRVVTQACWLGF